MAPTSYQSNPFDLVNPSWQGMKQNLKVAVQVYLTVIVAIAVMGIVTAILLRLVPLLGLLAVLATFIVAITYFILPFGRLALAGAKHEKPSYKELMKSDPGLAWRYFGTCLLSGLAIAGGMILLVVPGIIFLGWFINAPYVVLNEGLTGSAALGRSRELARGRKLEVYGALGVASVPSILIIVPAVGQLLSVIVSFFILPLQAIRYLQLNDLRKLDEETVAATPKSSANWGAIVLGLVILGIANTVYNKEHPRPMTPTQPIYNSVVMPVRVR